MLKSHTLSLMSVLLLIPFESTYSQAERPERPIGVDRRGEPPPAPESAAQKKARLAHEARIVRAAKAQRKREADETKAEVERVLHLPMKEATARVRAAGKSRDPADKRLIDVLVRRDPAMFADALKGAGGGGGGDLILLAVLAMAADRTADRAIDATLKAYEDAVNRAYQTWVEHEKRVKEKVMREKVFWERQRHQAEMNSSGKWSRLHPDRQKEILDVEYPGSKIP